jgi:two-component system chemotaxis response regulator CheY
MDQPNSPAQHLILVVDDAEDCLSTLDLALGSLPFVLVRAARSAEDAVTVLETAWRDRTKVSAIITDIHLPRMSGLELIAQIRSQPRWKGLPIVALSADADPDTPQRALRLGANAYFPKPFSPGAIRKKLEELIHA